VCVLDEDLRQIDPHEFVNVPVNTTVFSGKVVYERPTMTARVAAAPSSRADRRGHGIRCYEGGRCCCVLTEEIRAGRV
jgi:hypothetical protein